MPERPTTTPSERVTDHGAQISVGAVFIAAPSSAAAEKCTPNGDAAVSDSESLIHSEIKSARFEGALKIDEDSVILAF